MGTVIFDFDSTLVPCESLEVVLARAPGASAQDLERGAEITRLGMEGAISFHDSLTQRLEIARPARRDLIAVGEELAGGMTDGAPEVVAWLHDEGHDVWIVSGGFQEVLLPVAAALGIPAARVQGVRALWTGEGAFDGLDDDDAFAHSKVEGVRKLAPTWPHPSIGVGDGATDRALCDTGLVDAFIAYTEHVRRSFVAESGDIVEVGSMGALRDELQARLDSTTADVQSTCEEEKLR